MTGPHEGATASEVSDLGIARPREQKLAELARDIVSAAYLRGDFVLSSGIRSRFYFDKYLFETKPGILRAIARFLADLLPPETERIAGPELGAVALAASLSLETGLPFVIVKRAAKAYGTAKAVEGELHPGERVTVVEDVITTGSQAIAAASQLSRHSVRVLAVLSVIDREEGGSDKLAAAGYPLISLFSRSSLGLA